MIPGQASVFVRNMGLAVSLCLFTLVFVIGPTFLVPTQENDAKTVMRLAQDAPYTQGENSYYYTALASAYLSDAMQRALVYLLGSAFIYRALRDLRGPLAVGLTTVLMVAPIFLFLTLFVKDSTVPVLVIASLAVLRGSRPAWLRVMGVVALYLVYGVFFRNYYLLILAAFLLIAGMQRLSMVWWALAVIAAAIACLLIPETVYNQLVGSRDIINAHRLWSNAPGSRTAFMNALPPDGFVSFVLDYAYAALRLNLAPLFGLGIKELYLSLNVFAFGLLGWIGARSRDDRVRLPAMLFIAHVAILILFEPDLGSYLRHASSALLYLTPALMRIDAGIRIRRPRRVAHAWPGLQMAGQ